MSRHVGGERAAASGTLTELKAGPELGVARSLDIIPVAATQRAAGAPLAFVPIVAASPNLPGALSAQLAPPCLTLGLHVRLPNGLQFDVEQTGLETLSGMVQMLERDCCVPIRPRAEGGPASRLG